MSSLHRLTIAMGDITNERVDAIVNAANTDLILGMGVAGAVRTKGGPRIQQQCDENGPVELGGTALTDGGDLPAKYVIHAAVMRLGNRPTEESIRDATRNSLKLATEKHFDTISFPAFGTGIGGFAMDETANIMIREILDFQREHQLPHEIRIVLFDEFAYTVFRETLDKLLC